MILIGRIRGQHAGSSTSGMPICDSIKLSYKLVGSCCREPGLAYLIAGVYPLLISIIFEANETSSKKFETNESICRRE
jgi:hypothetical protein